MYALLAPADQAKIDAIGPALTGLGVQIANMSAAGTAAAVAQVAATTSTAAEIKDPVTNDRLGWWSAIIVAVSSVISGLFTLGRHKISPPDPRVEPKIPTA